MISVLIWLAIFCISFLVSLYVFDEPTFHKNPPVSPQKASVYDLPDNASRYKINEYINEHIIPADDYFALRNEFDSCRDAGDIAVILFMRVIPVVLMVMSLIKMFLDAKGLGFTLLICAAGVAVCVLLGWLLSKLYDRYWKVPEMDLDVPYLKRRLEQIDDEFGVGVPKAQANYMTLVYYSYCARIRNTMRKRLALKSVVSGICAVIYLLFFFRNPYE